MPQYHLRLFAGGKRYIHLASRDGSRFVSFASVRGQCARRKFYGNQRVEDWLGRLESRHAAVYRAVVDIAWGVRTSALSEEEHRSLREAILIQRSRTPRKARVVASSIDQMTLYAYCEYLKALPATRERQATITAIERGDVSVKDTQFISLMLSIQTASRAAAAIADLSLLVLRDHTTIPFVMGDTPCVFSNHYMRAIRDSGVLGFVTPGLMAVLPINSRTQVLLYDGAVYTPDYSTAGCIDIFRVADVSLLNALQILSAEENVYFSDLGAQTYLREMFSAHRRSLQDQGGGFAVHKPGGVLIDGVPSRGEVLHVFEPQLPITLDLSFISTASLPPSGTANRARNPELARWVEQALATASGHSPIEMDDFAKWMESRMNVSDGS
ncbi:MAG: DUF4238 domain-containing protein [bacterium]|nr:DUF4238 domain-containing protein [bacterium]